MHNSDNYCYHDGNQFITTHPVFTLMLDDALQSINASLTTPYWDFMIDSAEYGADWWRKSPMYRDDWFGAVNNSMADGAGSKGVVARGRFAALPEYYVGGTPQPSDQYDVWDARYA